jgi:DNA replication and repair protein RecF
MLDSFRHPEWEDVVLHGQETSVISLECIQNERDITLEMRIIDKKREYNLNGKKKKAFELYGLLPTVLFSPDDLQLIKGSSGARRELLDTLGSQLSRTYAELKRDYQKTLRQKNQLLKEHQQEILREPAILHSWNHNLVKIGSSLLQHRVSLFEKLLNKTTQIFKQLSAAEDLSACYRPSLLSYLNSNKEEESPVFLKGGEDGLPPKEDEFEGNPIFDRDLTTNSHKVNVQNKSYPSQIPLEKREVERLFFEALTLVQEEEIRRGVSLVGPHRDKIDFYINGRDIREFGSQGQQRTLVLAIKMAELEILREIHDNEPILLLDDVMSELDETRRNALLTMIDKKTQTFITTTNLGYFNRALLDKAQVVHLSKKEV